MNQGMPADGADPGDILDRLHQQGRKREDSVPRLDVEETVRLVRAVREASVREAGEAGFWAALSPAEQADLVSASRKRTFPAGTVLMREGERADSVMVLLAGRARVSVGGPGRERVIAERGPGDLIGEHGAPPASVRNATVTVVEPTVALVMTTEDFAAFLDAHPDLPDLVKQQAYDRPAGPAGPLATRGRLPRSSLRAPYRST